MVTHVQLSSCACKSYQFDNIIISMSSLPLHPHTPPITNQHHIKRPYKMYFKQCCTSENCQAGVIATSKLHQAATLTPIPLSIIATASSSSPTHNTAPLNNAQQTKLLPPQSVEQVTRPPPTHVKHHYFAGESKPSSVIMPTCTTTTPSSYRSSCSRCCHFPQKKKRTTTTSPSVRVSTSHPQINYIKQDHCIHQS